MTTPPQAEVFGTEYVLTAVLGDRIVGRAIRTNLGWHVPLYSQPPAPGRNPRRRWISADTTHEAAQRLYALAGVEGK